ncbi:MAG: putative Zn-dependent protease [Gammaproteobacteria bacterium]|jgi:predicted Zn-dependent protease
MKIRFYLPRNFLLALFMTTTVTGCITNPVTGNREIRLVSEGQELAMGQQSYAPLTQMEGGKYTVDPALGAYVSSVGRKMASVSDRNLPYEFVVVNNPIPNAWALPGGKIGINTGLLWELGSEAELAAVLGHEVIHAAAGHSARSQTRGMGIQLAVMSVAVGLGDKEYANIALGAAQLGSSLISSKYGRDAELESDEFGMNYMKRAGYNPQAAVALQKTFVRLSEGRQQQGFERFFSTHPPSQDRVEANQRSVSRLGADGEMHTKRYQQAIAKLKRSRPAYESLNKGKEALAKKDYGVALAYADQAIRIDSREAHFYILRGDVFMAQKSYRKALGSYQRALKNNQDYVGGWIGRGVAQYKLGKRSAAKADLEKSLEMLPTVAAHFALGNIARDSGDSETALGHYQAVAGSNAPQASEAMTQVVQIELHSAPGKYIASGQNIDQNGRLSVEVQNRADVAVSNVIVTVREGDRSWKVRISGTLNAGESHLQGTQLGPYTAEQAARISTAVTEARLAQ